MPLTLPTKKTKKSSPTFTGRTKLRKKSTYSFLIKLFLVGNPCFEVFSKVSYEFHFLHLLFSLKTFGSSFISHTYFDVQRRAVYRYTRLEMESDIGQLNVQSVPFSTGKNVENGTCKFLHKQFSMFFTMETETDWTFNQPMSLSISRRV